MTRELHRAESRGYRELYAFSRALARHWETLAGRVPDAAPSLRAGAAAARELISELEPVIAGYDLHGGPAAQGAGASIARQRTAVRDRFLERGQALRMAVEGAVHLCVLLGYLAAVAESVDDVELGAFVTRWERKMRRHESAVRKAAAAAGADPDGAVEPLDGSVAGRAAHGVGYALGSAGEWLDRRAARKS